MAKNLFKELELYSGAKLKNRMLMAPMTIQSGYFDGTVTQELIDYYAHRSGDAAAIIVESSFVEDKGRAFPGAIGVDTNDKVAGLKKLANAIHENGSKAILQIYHAGRMAAPEYNGGAQPISASPVAAPRPDAEVPLEMTEEEVEAMIGLFGDATLRAIEAGFDGVEIHGANTYLIQQFFSPHSNRRKDKWGGSREKRAMFPIEVLKKVQQVVEEQATENFIVGYRFSPEEIEDPGIRFDDTMYLLNELANYKPDYFHFSTNSWERTSIVDTNDAEPLIDKYFKTRSEKLEQVPIIGVGSIVQRQDAEAAIEKGYDLISIGKAYLVEPQWTTKVMNNENIKELADINEREELKIPAPLWKVMDFMIVDQVAEKRKYERLKALQNERVSFKPGTYLVSAQGHNGELPMEVSFSKDEVLNIKIDHRGESEGIANPAFERLPQEIIDGQTLNVDVISGATVTSEGVIGGVADAVEKAGANPDVLRARPKAAIEWSKERIEKTTDVIVIGSGGAGLSAAAQALENNCDVIVLEKFPATGGNTIRTGGPINAASPKWQRDFYSLHGEKETLDNLIKRDESEFKGKYLRDFRILKEQIKEYEENINRGEDYLFDSVELHRIQTYLGGKRVDRDGNPISGQYDLVKVLTSQALKSVEWLTEKGVQFDQSVVEMPVGALWRRGHKPMRAQGVEFIEVLEAYVKENGGTIMLETSADELMIEDGKVVGVKAKQANGTEVVIYGNNGVVLATGGFGANTDMLQQYNTYWAEIPNDVKTTNSPAITGDGLRMGKEAGANLVGMGFSQMMPVSDPKSGALFTGLIVAPADFVFVNQEGSRFVNEFESRDVLSQAAFENGGLFYIIADEEIKDMAINTSPEKIAREIEEGVIYKAETLEDLAKQININPAKLVTTIETYNAYVDAGHDPEFNKNAFNTKIDKGPFYATPRKPAVHHTMGGLKIDKETHVLDKHNQIIPSLYAAGEVAGGIHAGNRLGGNALADIFTFGRIAGENAAKKQ